MFLNRATPQTIRMLPVSRFAFMQVNNNNDLPIIDQGLITDVMDEVDQSDEGFMMKGRNSRKPKKANHGARPCSSYMRR